MKEMVSLIISLFVIELYPKVNLHIKSVEWKESKKEELFATEGDLKTSK